MTNQTTDKTPFLAFNVGKNEVDFYAFHMEGFLGKEPDFYTGDEEKGREPFCHFSIGVGRDAWNLVGETGKEPQKFIQCTAFGDLAKKIKALKKGQKVVVCGRPTRNKFTKKSGEDACNVQMIVDQLVVLSCKTGDGESPSNKVAHSISCYKTKAGDEKKENYACLLTGKVISVDEVKEFQGRKVINWQFAIELPGTKMAAITNGTYSKQADYGNYKVIRCAFWGERTAKMGKVLAVGNVLAVTGVPSVRSYEDRDYVNMTVRELSVVTWANSTNKGAVTTPDESEPEIVDFTNIDIEDEDYQLPF